MPSLQFIHLSDIHFKFENNNQLDLDDVIRHELIRDAYRETSNLPPPSGILVTGDIAYSGKSSEYSTAYGFINQLCQKLAIPIGSVKTVPGNHDVDRSRIMHSLTARLIQKALRECAVDEINQKLADAISDANGRKELFATIEEYNKFAGGFGCISSPDPLTWNWEVTLNDGSILRVCGLNSVIASNELDDDRSDSTKLILSEFQTKFFREDGVTYVTMSHHPLDWLRDKDTVEDWLDAHARIQLFGHKHVQRIRQVADNIRIAAGAMQPDRNEPGWEPRYNLISLEVVYKSKKRTLQVSINPRIWHDVRKEFVQDTGGIYTRELPLSDWSSGVADQKNTLEHEQISVVVEEIKQKLLNKEDAESVVEASILNATEKLTSRFLGLPNRLQKKVARDLGLILDTNSESSDTERYRQVFIHATEQLLLESLWTVVEEIYLELGESANPDNNPFKGM